MKKIKYNPNNEYIDVDKKDANKEGRLMLFYVDWCPYSKTTLKQWIDYKESYNKKYSITFDEIDCEVNVSIADEYNIESYPTIILVMNGKNYIYDAQMNDATLTQFINTIMK